MPDTQICKYCKRLWPEMLLFSEDGRCPRCQVISRVAIDEFQAEASVRMAIEDAEAELVRLRAILATYSGGPSKVQELRNDEGTVVGVQWEGESKEEHGPLDPPSPESEASWEDYKRRALEHLENS